MQKLAFKGACLKTSFILTNFVIKIFQITKAFSNAPTYQC